MNTIIAKPNLYQGERLRLSALDAESFQDFVVQAMGILGEHRGFGFVESTSNGRDGGFDGYAVRTKDKATVCVQAKRYARKLSKNHVALELCKVGLKSAAEGSSTKEHFIITSGAVQQDVREAIREIGRFELKRLAKEYVVVETDCKSSKEAVVAKGLNPDRIVDAYIDGLDVLNVWSGEDFDQALGVSWTRLQNLLEKYFAVHSVLREKPRPDFARTIYMKRMRSTKQFIDLPVRSAGPPPNLYCNTPPERSPEGVPSNTTQGPESIAEIATFPTSYRCIVLLADGGGGKTWSLIHIGDLLSQTADNHDTTPIFIDLCTSGADLEKAITDELGLTVGHWSSIPGDFLLLLDGFSDIKVSDARKISYEIERLLRQMPRIRFVVSVKSSGPAACCSLPFDSIYRILPWGLRGVYSACRLRLTHELANQFLDEYKRIQILREDVFFSLPFTVSALIEQFAETGGFSQTKSEVLDALVRSRFNDLGSKRDESQVSFDTLINLAAEFSFKIRVEFSLTTVTTADAETAMNEILNNWEKKQHLNKLGLTVREALELLDKSGLISRNGHWVFFHHDIVSGFLAAKVLAKNWQQHINSLESGLGPEIWIFASPIIPVEERAAFLRSIGDIDFVLLALVASEGGDNTSAERILTSVDEMKVPSSRAVRLCQALSLLKTDQCIFKLLHIANGADQILRNAARTGLGAAGHEPLLKEILPRIDRETSTPGITVSGGELDIWAAAPWSVRLRVAVERATKQPADPFLKTSLETIYWYGDQVNNQVFRDLIANPPDLNTLLYAFRYLNLRDPNLAVSELRKKLGKNGGKADIEIIKSLVSVGVGTEHEIDSLIAIVLQIARQHPDNGHAAIINNDILKSLENTNLSLSQRSLVVQAIKNSNDTVRYYAWRIGQACLIEDLAPYIVAAINSKIHNVIFAAANYAHRIGTQNGLGDQVFAAAEELLDSESVKFSNAEVALIRLVASSNPEKMGKLIAMRVEELRNRSHSTEDETFDACVVSRFNIEFQVQPLVDLAYTLRGTIAKETVLKIITFDLATSGNELTEKLRRIAVSRLTSSEIDAVLISIEDPFHASWMLEWASRTGATKARQDVFRRLFKQYFFHTPVSHKLSLALPMLWDQNFGYDVVKELSAIPFTGDSPMFASELLNQIGNLIERKFADDVMPSIINSTMHPLTKEFLQKLAEFGKRPRVIA